MKKKMMKYINHIIDIDKNLYINNAIKSLLKKKPADYKKNIEKYLEDSDDSFRSKLETIDLLNFIQENLKLIESRFEGLSRQETKQSISNTATYYEKNK